MNRTEAKIKNLELDGRDLRERIKKCGDYAEARPLIEEEYRLFNEWRALRDRLAWEQGE